MVIREEIEQREKQSLMRKAALAVNSREGP
jgi:hypothetical protein